MWPIGEAFWIKLLAGMLFTAGIAASTLRLAIQREEDLAVSASRDLPANHVVEQ